MTWALQPTTRAAARTVRTRWDRGKSSGAYTVHKFPGIGTAEVMADRLASARQISERFGAIAVLKGSGTVVAEPGRAPWINATGNARLATAGTGDALAGMIGAALARPHDDAAEAVRRAVAAHGALADHWPEGAALTAGRLALAARPL